MFQSGVNAGVYNRLVSGQALNFGLDQYLYMTTRLSSGVGVGLECITA